MQASLKPFMKNLGLLLLSIAVGALLAWGGSAISGRLPGARQQSMSDDADGRARWGKNYLPNVKVRSHDGKEFLFYDDLIKGKMVVINFIYTSCKDVCSLSTARLAEVRKRLGDRVGRDIFMYSITLDPLVDGPETLARYASNFATGEGWLFLTGSVADIDSIRMKLGERSEIKANHRNGVVLGNDATGDWSRDSVFSDVGRLASTILSMDPAERSRVRDVARMGGTGELLAFGDTPGKALFVKACAACHTIGQGVRVGPDLAGVTERRSEAWLKRFIPNPSRMIAEKDDTALKLSAEFNGLVMPDIGLSDPDVGDLLKYISSTSAQAQALAGSPKEVPR